MDIQLSPCFRIAFLFLGFSVTVCGFMAAPCIKFDKCIILELIAPEFNS